VVFNTYCVVFLFCMSSSWVLCKEVSNTYCVVVFNLFVFVVCLVHGGVQHILRCAFCFVSSSCVLRIVVSKTYCVVFSPFFLLVCLRLVSCVPNVANFSGLSIIDCLFGIL